MSREPITSLDQLEKGKFYRVKDLQAILAGMNLSFSIFTIRDYETWKCTNYKCGARSSTPVKKCTVCGALTRKPIIPSPRTAGGGKGPGHRRYSAAEIRKIVELFSKRY